MNDFLEGIGWKKYGKWNPTEIIIDTIALTILAGLLGVGSYFVML